MVAVSLLVVWLSATAVGRASAGCDVRDDGATVDCSLRILDFRRNSTDGVINGVAKNKAPPASLNVHCSDVFFFESQLRSDHFGSVPTLLELSVRYCKLRSLPPRSFVGLSSLRYLTVNTYNADWASLTLSPDYEAFVGLGSLETLDLTENNIHKLPAGLLCPLDSVKLVNLSKNAFSSLGDLGLSRQREDDKCNVPAEELVLSFNRISSVTPGALDIMDRLLSLDLSNNDLGVLVENALQGMDNLEVLDLSHNRLVSLPPKIFNSTVKLRELQLSNNSIGTIDLEAFSSLTNLQVLNLSGNSLDENWIKPGIFKGLRKLILLDLSANHISKIEVELFQDLTALQVLNIGHNNLHTISSNAFASQVNLHILVLSHNQLESLHHQTLTGLSVLNSLSLDHNRLHSLDEVLLLKSCEGLKELSLANNFLTQIPKALDSMPSLTVLDLSSNVIGVLKRQSLQGLPKLTTLKIARNELTRVGEDTFKDSQQVKHLDLGGNRFQALEQNTFKDLSGLQSLNLSDNQLVDLNGLLQSLSRLKWLDLSHNRLAWFDFAFVPPSVEWMDISHNLVDALENYYGLKDNLGLKYLDASKNLIERLEPMSILPSMEHVFLQENMINDIAPNTFVGKYALKQVHLEKNKLATLSTKALLVTPQTDMPMFYLAGNPFVCDCHLQWFKQIHNQMSEFPHVVDSDQVTCSVRNHTGSVLDNQQLARVPEDHFLCHYEKRCFPDCMCCDFFACDCQIKCPEGCTCLRDQDWSANVVECSAADLHRVPEVVPMDTTVLYLDGNNLTEMTPGVLVGRSRLRTLSARGSQIGKIANQSFAGLFELQVLDLGHNQLKHLLGHEFVGLSMLRELHLEHNQLVSMASNTFKSLRYLSLLTLDGNLLISFPIWELSSNPNLMLLTLADNWWQCDCDFVRKFRMFVDGNIDIIPDAARITCTSSDNQQLNQCSGVLGRGSEGSGGTGAFSFDQDYAMLPVAIGISVLFVGSVVAVLAAIKLRRNCLIWLHASYGIRLCPVAKNSKSSKDPILFDALVIYSVKDEKFVHDDLCKPLESASYRLCLHHRDLAGIYTSEAFKSALTASARLVLVLSQGFMATEWDHVRRELTLEDTAAIIVLASDTDRTELTSANPDAAKVIKTASSVLKWQHEKGEKKFFRRLRFQLPDPDLSKVRKKTAAVEGGAELDVSGVWTFSSSSADDSNARLISSPQPQAALFPAPPVKKQPHQCSTHYLAGAPSCNQQCNDYHQRSFSQGLTAMPNTRSCGTNVVVHHQRSISATANAVNKSHSFKHQRSSSSNLMGRQFPNADEDDSNEQHPPPPPPKVKQKHSFYNYQQQLDVSSLIYSNPPSILQRILSDTADPGAFLLQRLPPVGQADPAPKKATSSSSSLALIPLKAAADKRIPDHSAAHVRSTSLLETPGPRVPHYVRHDRSSSSAALEGTPKAIQRRSSVLLQQRTNAEKPLEHQARQPQRLQQHQRHQSALNLVQNDSSSPVHCRSASTPYNEGFVL